MHPTNLSNPFLTCLNPHCYSKIVLLAGCTRIYLHFHHLIVLLIRNPPTYLLLRSLTSSPSRNPHPLRLVTPYFMLRPLHHNRYTALLRPAARKPIGSPTWIGVSRSSFNSLHYQHIPSGLVRRRNCPRSTLRVRRAVRNLSAPPSSSRTLLLPSSHPLLTKYVLHSVFPLDLMLICASIADQFSLSASPFVVASLSRLCCAYHQIFRPTGIHLSPAETQSR